MKLAEAKSRIKEIDERITTVRERLKTISLNAVSSLMDELNSLSVERQQLQIGLSQSESETFVAGSSLQSLVFVLDAVEIKIASLMDLKQRDDLSAEVYSNIFDQIDTFSRIRNQLKTSMEKTYWQVDLEIQTQFGDRSPK